MLSFKFFHLFLNRPPSVSASASSVRRGGPHFTSKVRTQAELSVGSAEQMRVPADQLGKPPEHLPRAGCHPAFLLCWGFPAAGKIDVIPVTALMHI